jgi:hypothetical protein
MIRSEELGSVVYLSDKSPEGFTHSLSSFAHIVEVSE